MDSRHCVGLVMRVVASDMRKELVCGEVVETCLLSVFASRALFMLAAVSR
jgi:hypothetical protein